MLHDGKETIFFPKSYVIDAKILHLPSNLSAMKRKVNLIIALLASVLLFSGCASSTSRAMRKAEREMARQERQVEKQYNKARSSHYDKQARKTKRMIRQDRRRAERLRRRQHSNPYF